MVNLIWSCMAIIGIVYAMINGTMDQVNKALFESASDAVTLSIGLISILVFWLGIMKIAEKAGILTTLAKLFRTFILQLFTYITSHNPAIVYILSNVTDIVFGLGNAATPMGIKEMEQMKQLS